MKNRYQAIVAYDGLGYRGWQLQLHEGHEHPSLQAEVQSAFSEIFTGKKVLVTSSGRTDTDVHAFWQVVHFDLEVEFEPSKLRLALNAKLPKKIRILKIEKSDENFHARKSALKKRYDYYFLTGPASIPYLQMKSWYHPKNLDLKKMNDASKFLIGRHDFKAFQGAKSKVQSSTREIFSAEIEDLTEKAYFLDSEDLRDLGFQFFRFRVVGEGFLRQMVRSISGTLKEIGEGSFEPGYMKQVIEEKDRKLVGITAPGHGLFLSRVWYPVVEPTE